MSKFCPYATGALNMKHNRSALCFKSKNKNFVKEYKTIYDLLNNPPMNQTRLDLASGKWPEDNNCLSCVDNEKINGRSARIRAIDGLSETTTEWLKNNLNADGSINTIINLELRFRSSCNLACRHCSSEYSTQWSKIIDELGEQPYYDRDEENDISLSKNIPISDWIEFIKEQINADIFKQDPNLLFYLEFTGGEPFFQKELYQFLEQLDQHPEYKKRIEFAVTTNGIITNRFKNYDLKKLLSGFGKMWICLSLDASENFYEYFRQNGNWEQATTGVIALSHDMPNTRVSFSVSPTVFQCLRADDIYKDFAKLLKRPLTRRDIIISDIYAPYYLRLDNAHPELKKSLVKQLTESKIKHNDPAFDNLVDLSLKQLAQPGDINEWIAFCDMTSRLDKIHNKNVFDYFPELKQYWIS